MPVSNDLFLAVLAMDSYNRGYNAGVTISGSSIGTAQLGQGTNAVTEPAAVAASFYAQAYNWNGTIVISYRGTDDPNIALNSDIFTGWTVGLGYQGGQAKLDLRDLRGQDTNCLNSLNQCMNSTLDDLQNCELRRA